MAGEGMVVGTVQGGGCEVGCLCSKGYISV
jgi:hypothetical protein